MVDNKCDNDQNGEHRSEVVKYVSDELPILGELRKAFTGDSTGPPPLQADENVTSLSDSIDLSSLCSVVETFGEERNSSSSLRKILGGKSDDDDEWEKDYDSGGTIGESPPERSFVPPSEYVSPKGSRKTSHVEELRAEGTLQKMSAINMDDVSKKVENFAISPKKKADNSPPAAPPVGLGGAGRALAAAYYAAESLPYKRAIIPAPSLTPQDELFCTNIIKMLAKRKYYLYPMHTSKVDGAWDPKELEHCGRNGDYIEATPMSSAPFRMELKEDSDLTFKFENGIFVPCEENSAIKVPVDFHTYLADLFDITYMMNSAPFSSFAHRRMKLLEEKFSLYQMLNAEKEFLAIKALSHRDFYNVRKIDNHVHHSACMNQKHLLRFIKKRVREDGDRPVIERDGKVLTLKEVFDTLGLSPYELNIDVLDMHAHNTKNTTFYRFDKFNQKFNPTGEARLREIFLKTDNYVKGKYLAKITKEVFEDLAASKYQMAEYRLSVYGKNKQEWSKLAAWWYDNALVSPNVVWMIQIPRLYQIYKKSGMLKNFGEFLCNIFEPLIEISKTPSKDPKLNAFLENIVGFDIVDDESVHERKISKKMPTPDGWDRDTNPSYNYYLYYIYANLCVLNSFRSQRGMSQFAFRPHAGEAGDLDHLAGTFLLANSINHGIQLKKSPVLQYLYYLAQIGLAMSPLSNNCLFCEYSKNPFKEFFERGLNVALSTDDPLLIHMTKEPLVEEYSIAMQVYKLSTADLSEIARNSVLQSGFPQNLKQHWVGGSEMFENDPYQSNVPDIRIKFRKETLEEELRMVREHANC